MTTDHRVVERPEGRHQVAARRPRPSSRDNYRRIKLVAVAGEAD
jgi:hypothetical protein